MTQSITFIFQGFYNRGKHLLCEKCYLIVIAHKLTKCPLCKQPVGVGKYIRALDRSWHIDCFICVDCKNHLDKEYYNVGEKVYCDKCINTGPQSEIDKTDSTTLSSATVSKKSSPSQKSDSAIPEIYKDSVAFWNFFLY